MQARMSNPVMILPDAMQALLALAKSTEKGGVPSRTLELVHLRASQINGCSVCVDGHPRIAKKAGETDERLFAVVAWRDAPYFTDAERAALALTEAVTRLSDRPDPVSTRSGTRPPGTTTSRRWRPWSSPSPRSTSGTASTSPPGSRPASGPPERHRAARSSPRHAVTAARRRARVTWVGGSAVVDGPGRPEQPDRVEGRHVNDGRTSCSPSAGSSLRCWTVTLAPRPRHHPVDGGCFVLGEERALPRAFLTTVTR